MNNCTALTLQFIETSLTRTERTRLAKLLDLPDSAKSKQLFHAALRDNLTPETIIWYLDLYGVAGFIGPEPAKPAHQILQDLFTDHELRVLYRKLGFTLGFEPMSVVLDNIQEAARTNKWDLPTLRTFCDTRKLPFIKEGVIT